MFRNLPSFRLALLPFMVGSSAGVLRAQEEVLIREIVAREYSVHVENGEADREVISREFTVHVENGEDDGEVVSREFSVLVSDDAVPPPVTQLEATPSATGESLFLDWSGYDPLAIRDVVRFDIYLSEAGPFDNVTGMEPYDSVGGAITSHTLDGLTGSTDYYVAVVAVDGEENQDKEVQYAAAYIVTGEVFSREYAVHVENGASDQEVVSREFSVLVSDDDLPPPVAELVVSSSPLGDEVTLDWSSYDQLAVGDISRFDIYLSDTAPFADVSDLTPYDSVGAESNSVTLPELTPNTDHYFAVVPVDGEGNQTDSVTYATAYVVTAEVVAREFSIYVENGSEESETFSREFSVVVGDAAVPEAVTGLDSGFTAVTSTQALGAIDLAWPDYDELAQRDVTRYRVYVDNKFFSDVSQMTPYQILSAEQNSATVAGFRSFEILYVAVVAEDALGNFDPAVRSVSAQASYAVPRPTRQFFVPDLPDTLVDILFNPGASAQEDERQGESVALEGSVAVVGVPFNDSNLEGGVVKIYDITSSTLRLTLANPDPHGGRPLFGQAVAISGNLVAVGAPGSDFDAHTDLGIVYVYDLAGETPGFPVARLRPPVPGSGFQFGQSVAIEGSQVVVGTNDGGTTYVYDVAGRASGETVLDPDWTLVGTGGASAVSVAIAGSRVAVGRPAHGAPSNNSGSVSLFDLTNPDPSAAVIEILNPVPAAEANFGAAVDLRGRMLAVGAPGHADPAAASGRLYLYDLSVSTTMPDQVFDNPSPEPEADRFGTAVALDAGFVIGTAPHDDVGGLSGSAFAFDLSLPDPGAALITLRIPDPGPEPSFGFSADASDGNILIGASQVDIDAVDSGAAYLYDLRAPLNAPRRLATPSLASFDEFGSTLAVNGELIAVGVPNYDEGFSDSGRVYLYDRSAPDPGVPLHILENPTAEESARFGAALGFQGNLLAVGAPGHAPAGPEGERSGIVYLYNLEEDPPRLVEMVENPNPTADAEFGNALILDDERLLIGASQDSSDALFAGRAYVYQLVTSIDDVVDVQLDLVLRHPALTPDALFGSSLALQGNYAVIGAPGSASIYVYELAGLTGQEVPIASLQTGIRSFGASLAITNVERRIFLAIGAPDEEFSEGVVYLYTLADLQQANPQPRSTLSVNRTGPGAGPMRFGHALTTTGPFLAVGVPRQHTGAEEAGGAYLYDLQRSDPSTPIAELAHPFPRAGDQLGWSIAADGGLLALGVPGLDGPALDRGAVFLYSPDPFSPLGSDYVRNSNAESGATNFWSARGIEASPSGEWPSAGLDANQSLGAFVFAAAGNAPGEEISQTFAFETTGLIDAGLQRFSFQALLLANTRDENAGSAEIELAFRDAEGQLLQRFLFADQDTLVADWELVEEFAVVPVGARSVDVVLRSDRTGERTGGAAFDNVSLILTESDFLRRIDLDSRVHLAGSPVEVALDPGNYTVSAVPRGRFEAWHGWFESVGNTGDVDGTGSDLFTGWDWSYLIEAPSLGALPVEVGGNPSPGRRYRTSGLAFREAYLGGGTRAPANYSFTLRRAETIRFSIPHPASSADDNAGGISLIVERQGGQDDHVAHGLGPLPYVGFEDSPLRSVSFQDGRFTLEESPGGLPTGERAGVSVRRRSGGNQVTVAFDREVLGWLPTHAGITWIGGLAPRGVLAEFFNSDGLLVTNIGPADVSATARDVFFGAVYRGGIASFTITALGGNGTMQLDHLQYGLAPDPLDDPAFEPRFANDPDLMKWATVHTALTLPGGDRVVGGAFSLAGGVARPGLVRLHEASGQVVATWNPDLRPNESPPEVMALAVHRDTLLAGGSFLAGESNRNLSAISLADGSVLDRNLPALDEPVISLAVVEDALFVATASQVARYDFDEARGEFSPPTWTTPIPELAAVLPLGDHLYLGGAFAGGLRRLGLANGLSDPLWTPDWSIPGPARVHQLLTDGVSLYVRGSDNGGDGFLHKLRAANGAPDTAWTAPVTGDLTGATLAGTDLHLAFADGSLRRASAVDGIQDSNWTHQVQGSAGTLLATPTALHLFGQFHKVDDSSALGAATIDLTNDVASARPALGQPGSIFTLARQPDGKLLVGGNFHFADGRAVTHLIRLLPDTDRLDLSWFPTFAGGAVRTIAIAGDEIVVGGDFTHAGEVEASLVKFELFADGAPDPDWLPDVREVTALATTRDHVYVGGVYPPATEPELRRLDRQSGSPDPTWNPEIRNESNRTAIHTVRVRDGRLYVGGRFTQAGGATRPSLARFDLPDGTLDPFWNPNLFLGIDSPPDVYDLAFDPLFVYAGGRFATAQGSPQPNLARFTIEADTPAPQPQADFDASWRPTVPEAPRALLLRGENLFAAHEALYNIKTNLSPSAAVALASADGPIRHLALDSGRILAGGRFRSFADDSAGSFGAIPFLGSARIAYEESRIFIYPDDGTGPFVGGFEILSFEGGTLLRPGGEPLAPGDRITIDEALAGLEWIASDGIARQNLRVSPLTPGNLNSPDLSPTRSQIVGDETTPYFEFNEPVREVFEGDLLTAFVDFVGPPATGSTVSYEILTATARRFDGSSGDYIDVTLPLRFEFNSQLGRFQAALRVPILADSDIEGREDFFIRLVDPTTGFALGPQSVMRVRINDGSRQTIDGVPPAVLDPLRFSRPEPFVPSPTTSLSVYLAPDSAAAPDRGWRPFGEARWLSSGSKISNLQEDTWHHVEYRPITGYQPILSPTRSYVTSGANALNATYRDSPEPVDGSLEVLIEPSELAGDGKWRRVGEDELDWKDSSLVTLPPGKHLLEFNPLPGWTAPAPLPVTVIAGSTTTIRRTYLRDEGRPVPAPLDSSTVQRSPYEFVGQIESEFGFATGTAVSEQTVLTAAKVFWNPDTLTITGTAAWLHQKQTSDYQPGARNPRGVLILSGYASQLAEDRSAGTSDNPTGNLASDNLDVAVAYFYDAPVARGGFSGFLADFSPTPGFNPALLSDSAKLFAGYPMSRTDRPGSMHATSPAPIRLIPVQKQVYETEEFQGRPGMEGAPLFALHSNGNYYPAAIYLGENDQARFRALDGNVAELIYRAEYIAAIANLGGGTGGGDEFKNRIRGDDFPIGFIVPNLPQGIGRYRAVQPQPPHEPVSVWFLPNEPAPVLAGSWQLQFEPVPGLNTPALLDIDVQSNRPVSARAALYTTSFELWQASQFSADEIETQPEISGVLADPDRDGLLNLFEYAFDLPARISAYAQPDRQSATPGTPEITFDPSSSPLTLTVRFLRRSADFAPDLKYIVELTDDPETGWTPGNPADYSIEETVDTTWQWVTFRTSFPPSADIQFCRVRVEHVIDGP